MDRSQEIIRTSWIGIIANVLLAGFKASLSVCPLYKGISTDYVRDGPKTVMK